MLDQNSHDEKMLRQRQLTEDINKWQNDREKLEKENVTLKREIIKINYSISEKAGKYLYEIYPSFYSSARVLIKADIGEMLRMCATAFSFTSAGPSEYYYNTFLNLGNRLDGCTAEELTFEDIVEIYELTKHIFSNVCGERPPIDRYSDKVSLIQQMRILVEEIHKRIPAFFVAIEALFIAIDFVNGQSPAYESLRQFISFDCKEESDQILKYHDKIFVNTSCIIRCSMCIDRLKREQEKQMETREEPTHRTSHKNRIRDWLGGILGGFGIVLYYAFALLVATLPAGMISSNFWAIFAIITIIQLFPISNLVFWPWGLVCAITGPQDFLAILYYIVFAILALHFLFDIIVNIVSAIQNR